MKKHIYIVLGSAILFGMSFIPFQNDKLFEISKNIEIFVNVYKELNANYVDDLDPGKLMRTGIDAMVKSLDPYTNFISESQIESYRISDDGTYNGIGAQMKSIDNYLTIIETFENSSVIEAGLQAGDQIIEINGLSTKGKTKEEADALLRGVNGTSINLKISRPYPSKTFDVSLERGGFIASNVPYSGFVSDDVGYISLTTFTANAGKNVAKAFKDLKKENPSMTGVILDLRNNGGGLLREAVNVSNVFIPKNEKIVSTKGKVIERDQSYDTKNEPIDLDLPMAVLINKKSASASEIVSGVIQDLDRGILIGQRSYGKGLVQNQKEVGYNSRVKVTTSKYYIPSGRCIQSVEYANGEPVDISDDERSTFKTKNGRPVLDGGGVTPDVKMEVVLLDPIVKALLDENVIFKYVNKYVSNQKDTLDLKEIAFTDFQDFKGFANSENFDFNLELENSLEKLKDIEGESTYYSMIESQIGNIKTALKSKKDESLDKNKDQILLEIEKEIAGRYYFKKGEVFSTLDRDPEVNKAIDLLSNNSTYNQLLK